MVDALQSLLPSPVPIHHLGMYREKTTLDPVEYYNNLPYHKASTGAAGEAKVPDLAIVVDPIIATGSTVCAAIETLSDSWTQAQERSNRASQDQLARTLYSLKEALDLLNVSMEQGHSLYRTIVKKMIPMHNIDRAEDRTAA